MTETLSHTFINNNSKNTILFLHGWGCNQSYMYALSESKLYNSLIIDLPGFGKNKELNTPDQIDDFIEEILLFVNNFPYKITHIVSHSFGGKLTCRLYKFIKIKGIILIAPSIFHKTRGPKYYIKVMLYKIIKHIKLFKKTRNKMGSEDYVNLPPLMKKTMSNIINESVVKDVCKIDVPTIILTGNKDKITPIYLAKKAKKCIKDCEIIIQEGNHFAFLYNKFQTIRIIESLVSQTCN